MMFQVLILGALQKGSSRIFESQSGALTPIHSHPGCGTCNVARADAEDNIPTILTRTLRAADTLFLLVSILLSCLAEHRSGVHWLRLRLICLPCAREAGNSYLIHRDSVILQSLLGRYGCFAV